MMVDLSPASRLTRKRNMLLQKQLGVRLQILADEYRMTKKDLDKNSRDLGVFMMCLRDRAPGLSTYGQPDTRAMNARNILHDRQSGTARKKDDGNDVMSQVSKPPKGSKKDDTPKKPGGKSENGTEDSNENDPSKSPSSRSNKNEFFNRRIVLDSKRRSFLQHCMNNEGGKTQDPRRLGGAATHSGFLSNRDTAGEATSKPRPQTAGLLSQRSKTPRYGSDAYSEREENIRQHILGRFDVIFDPQHANSRGTIRQSSTSSTPLYLPKSATIPEESTQDVSSSRPPPGPSLPSGYVLNRRVAWSAPPKRRETPAAPHVNGNDNNASAAATARQNLSVTPRSGTAGMANAFRRSSSATCSRSAMPISDGREAEMEKSVNQTVQSAKRDPHRPRTAPPVYQLMQKSVAAPRQQVAGILAEIQSRRADTRAILLKSKQLKKMVRALAPEEKDDDSYSSD